MIERNVDRIPPQNLTAEMAAIGSMLVDRDLIPIVRAIVSAGDFHALIHEQIFTACEALHDAGRPLDKIALAEELKRRGLLERVGGLPYLNSLIDVVPTASSAEYYATLVREKAMLRSLISAGGKIVTIGYEGESDVDRAVSSAEQLLRDATRASAVATGTSLHAGVVEAYEELSEISTGKRDNGAILTPWRGVNDLVGGFFPGELVVVAAAPAQGKTGLMICLADYIAAKYGRVIFFSLEMRPRRLTQRWLALYSEVSVRTQVLGKLRDAEWDRLGAALSVVASRDVMLFGRAEASKLSQIARITAKEAREKPVVALVIDHVNFIADADVGPREAMTKHDRLDRVYRQLLQVADELGVVIFAVQHLNRAGMDGAPSLKNIRDGGNPEGHAHAILMPYRPEAKSDDHAARARGELHVAKSRDGEEGVVPLSFYGWRHAWADKDAALWFEEPA